MKTLRIGWFETKILPSLSIHETQKNTSFLKTAVKYVYLQCMKKEINKSIIIESVSKMIADKEVVRSYIKGKTTIQTLTKKGIKLAKPI